MSQGALRSRHMVRLALATIAASTATGVHATLTRPLPAFAPHGEHFVVGFVLRDRAGHPVNAAHVTVKVICPTRDAWSYAYASGSHPNGRYRIVATAPPGGLGTIVIRIGSETIPITKT
jgi:hypothetical protein